MHWLSRLRRRLRLVFHRSDVEREMADEMRFHLEMEADELSRFGVADPSRVARRRFGGVARYQDEARDARGGRWLEELRQDGRYALRVLARGRGFVVVSMLTLALGVGANTAIFSVVRGVLFRALPYDHPDRLVAIESVIGGGATAASPPDFFDWRAQSKSFSGLSAYFLSTTALSGGGRGDAERLNQARVSANFFDVVGVRLERGRGFRAGEDDISAPRVAILSDGLWRRRFGGDESLIGRTILLDDFPTTVIGIAPPELRMPAGVDVWMTTRFDARDVRPSSRGARWIQVVARLAPGASLATARSEMTMIAARLAQVDPKHDVDVGSRVTPLQEDIVGGVRTPLLILLGAVGFVMLIACVNIASLSLGRTAARETELAVRAALGAGRGRIARQILTESVVLALGGGIAGLALAVVALRGLVALAPGELPLLHAVHLDGVVFSYALGLTGLSGLLFGAIPAIQGSRANTNDRLRSGTRGVSSGPGGGRLRSVLVVVEVALAITLLAGAGLLIRSFLNLTSVDPGFRASGATTFTISLSPVRYPDRARQEQFARTLLSRLDQIPGMSSTGVSFSLPLTGSGFGLTFAISGRPTPSANDEPRAQVRVATPGYFRAMGIPLLRGRGFTAEDRPGAAMALLISQEAARRHWPNEDPIGQKLETGWHHDDRALGGTIVGVVGDVRQFSLAARPNAHIYAALAQWPLDEISVVMRSTITPAATLAAARDVVRALDPQLPIYDARPVEDIVRESVAERRFYALLLGTFATLALVLAAVGIYGVIAYAVQQRRRELGIRVALGASRRRVVAMVMRQALALTLIGAAAGLAAAAALTRVLQGQLFSVTTTDPLTFVAVPTVLIAVAVLAGFVPARRALAVDPASAMRADD